MVGRSLSRSASVAQRGVALKIGREELFDLLGERSELLRQMFAGMFKHEQPTPSRSDDAQVRLVP